MISPRVANRKKIIIPCLQAKMLRANATQAGLAAEAGVAQWTVNSAIKGNEVLLNNGLAMIEALNTRIFIRRRK